MGFHVASWPVGSALVRLSTKHATVADTGRSSCGQETTQRRTRRGVEFSVGSRVELAEVVAVGLKGAAGELRAVVSVDAIRHAEMAYQAFDELHSSLRRDCSY